MDNKRKVHLEIDNIGGEDIKSDSFLAHYHLVDDILGENVACYSVCCNKRFFPYPFGYEIAYLVNKKHRNKGYSSHGLLILSDMLLRQHDLPMLYLLINDAHGVSKSVAHKCDFIDMGEFHDYNDNGSIKARRNIFCLYNPDSTIVEKAIMKRFEGMPSMAEYIRKQHSDYLELKAIREGIIGEMGKTLRKSVDN